jgi:predicted Zn-dependent protease with MMP-like domain
MNISTAQFDKLVEEAINTLPLKYQKRLHNVAFVIADRPSANERQKLKIRSDYSLFGLYEGYHQSSRRNMGVVLPDKITIFKLEICEQCQNEEEIKKLIFNTVKHEIAHHFGSNEEGAKKVEIL